MSEKNFEPLKKNKSGKSISGRSDRDVNKIVNSINKAYGMKVAVRVDNDCARRIVVDLRSVTQFKICGLFYIDIYETGNVTIVREGRELLTWDCSSLNTFEIVNFVTIFLEMLFASGVSHVKVVGTCARSGNVLIMRSDGFLAYVYSKVLLLAIKYKMVMLVGAKVTKDGKFNGNDIEYLPMHKVSERWGLV